MPTHNLVDAALAAADAAEAVVKRYIEVQNSEALFTRKL